MKRNLVFAAFAIYLLTACAALGVPAPETFNQRLAVGYTSVTGVRETTITLLTANRISVADAQNIQKSADTVREGLDVARTLHAEWPQAGEDKLAVTLTLLKTLQDYLGSKK